MRETSTTTESLESILQSASVSDVETFLKENAEDLFDKEHPFSAYMRRILKEKNIRQQDLFIAADMPERYGYKIISEEKHTRQRDVIIRLCLAGRFSLVQAQRALKLYGMNELYARIPRDAVMMIAFNKEIFDIHSFNQLLIQHGMEPLYECKSAD